MTFYLPPAVIEAYNDLAAQLPPKQKSMVAITAIVALLEMDEESRRRMIRQTQETQLLGGSYADLVARAKDRGAAAAKLPPVHAGRVRNSEPATPRQRK